MHLLRNPTPLNYRAIFGHLLLVVKFLGLALLPPALVSLLTGAPYEAARFLAVGCLAWLLGRAAESRPPEPELREALLVAAGGYLLAALLGGILFLPVASALDGCFEAMSGFTTTGLSVLDPASLSPGLLFFRSYSQWLGGAGIIVLSLVVFTAPGRASFQFSATELGRQNLTGSLAATARIVLRIYLALTLLGFLLFMACGMKPFSALLHVLATVSTGGFSPHGLSLATYRDAGNWQLESAVILMMLLGAVSFPLYYRLLRGGVRQIGGDPQVAGLLCLVVLGFLFSGGTGNTAPLHGLFETVSALTTTGFSTSAPNSWSEENRFAALLLMAVGGSIGSTAGGLKILRLLVLLKLGLWAVQRLILPAEARVALKYGNTAISEGEIRTCAGFLVLYLGLAGLSALALTAAGHPALDSLFESVSALSTVGLSSGITGPGLDGWQKLVLIFDMWAGRLEILPLCVALYPGTWLPARRMAR